MEQFTMQIVKIFVILLKPILMEPVFQQSAVTTPVHQNILIPATLFVVTSITIRTVLIFLPAAAMQEELLNTVTVRPLEWPDLIVKNNLHTKGNKKMKKG